MLPLTPTSHFVSFLALFGGAFAFLPAQPSLVFGGCARSRILERFTRSTVCRTSNCRAGLLFYAIHRAIFLPRPKSFSFRYAYPAEALSLHFCGLPPSLSFLLVYASRSSCKPCPPVEGALAAPVIRELHRSKSRRSSLSLYFLLGKKKPTKYKTQQIPTAKRHVYRAAVQRCQKSLATCAANATVPTDLWSAGTTTQQS